MKARELFLSRGYVGSNIHAREWPSPGSVGKTMEAKKKIVCVYWS
jgi:hypothetical protein